MRQGTRRSWPEIPIDGGGTRDKTDSGVVAQKIDVPTSRSYKRSPSHLALVPAIQAPHENANRNDVARDNIGTESEQKRSPSQLYLVPPTQAAQSVPVEKPAKARRGKLMLGLLAGGAFAVVATIIVLLPSVPNAIAGLSIRELASIEAIVFLSGVMSGLSGFGFSAIGAASLLFLAPILQVPLFQTLSTGNQLLSAGQLRKDMPHSRKELWAGPGPCMLGGAGGVPIGIWVLSHLPASRLMTVFGSLLTVYAVYSMFKPASLKLRGFGGPLYGAAVGFLGGVVGGFTAFPGAAVVVWTGLRGLSKEKHRAIVQPYIIMSQIYSLGLVALLHPAYMNGRFWLLLALTLPAVVPGTLSGLAIYRRTSDVNFKRITYLLLALSGMALLAKTCGPAIRSLF
jgi:uncharacterized protein